MGATVSENIIDVKSTLPAGVELVAVSKFQPVERLKEAYASGQRLFGESRVNELLEKAVQMPDDVRWHFIGHLQTNKVKQVVGKVALIESVDSQRLLELIDNLSERAGITTDVLMQVHVAAEETKFGWLPDELIRFFTEGRYKGLRATRIRGLMGMATNTDDERRINADFAEIVALRDRILAVATGLTDFDLLSMGMSDDYPLAIAHGANLVRIGSRIFGERR